MQLWCVWLHFSVVAHVVLCFSPTYLQREETCGLCYSPPNEENTRSKCDDDYCTSSTKTLDEKCQLPKNFDLLPKCTRSSCGLYLNAYRYYNTKVPIAVRSALMLTTPNMMENLLLAMNSSQTLECNSLQVNQTSSHPKDRSLFYDCWTEALSPNVYTSLTFAIKNQAVKYLFNMPHG